MKTAVNFDILVEILVKFQNICDFLSSLVFEDAWKYVIETANMLFQHLD